MADSRVPFRQTLRGAGIASEPRTANEPTKGSVLSSAAPAPRKHHCPTGKRIYWKARLANRAITEAQKRGELPTMRHYQCPHCGWWHLSKKERRHDGD